MHVFFDDTRFSFMTSSLSYFFLLTVTLWLFFSTVVAIGQLITRLQLSLRGRSQNEFPMDARGSFRFFFRLVCIYWTYRVVMFWFIDFLDPSTATLSFDASKLERIKDREPPGIYYLMCAFNDLVWYCYFGSLCLILKNIR